MNREVCIRELDPRESTVVSLIKTIPWATGIAGVLALWLWLGGEDTRSWEIRRPGTDLEGVHAASMVETARFEGQLLRSGGKPSNLPGAWPGFRGPDLDGISRERVALARSWNQGPRQLWGIDVGEGYAGASILNGRVYLMDYDAQAGGSNRTSPGNDALRCLSLADGSEIWRYTYPVKVKRNHGMSRTIPAVSKEVVVGLGPKCRVICLDAGSGELLWKLDLVETYGTRVPPWYAGQCPLIDGDRLILAPGGDEALMISLDLRTGEVVWRTPNPRGWNMTHASIVPMMISGRRTYVYCGSGGVVGVAADDGTILWETRDWKISIATIASPLDLGDGRIFFAGGYNAGSMMLRVREEAGVWASEEMFRLKPEVFGATQQTPIFYKGHIYGVRPNGELACLSPEGRVLWTSGTARKFGLGPFLIADGLILAMDDSGLLRVAEATSDHYNQLTEVQVLEGHDSWGPMALAGGRLIARDLTRMVCLDISAN